MSDLTTVHNDSYLDLSPQDQARLDELAYEGGVWVRDMKRSAIRLGGVFSEAREILRHNKAGGFDGWIAAHFSE